MSVWSTANSSPTKDPRVRVGQWGAGNWRTLVRDDDWNETGPPYPSKAVAMGHVDDVLADYFGELPSRALLAERIEAALAIAREYGTTTSAAGQVVGMMAKALQGHQVAEPEPDQCPRCGHPDEVHNVERCGQCPGERCRRSGGAA